MGVFPVRGEPVEPCKIPFDKLRANGSRDNLALSSYYVSSVGFFYPLENLKLCDFAALGLCAKPLLFTRINVGQNVFCRSVLPQKQYNLILSHKSNHAFRQSYVLYEPQFLQIHTQSNGRIVKEIAHFPKRSA